MGFVSYMSQRERLLVWKRLAVEKDSIIQSIKFTTGALTWEHFRRFEMNMCGLLSDILLGQSGAVRERPAMIQGFFKTFMGLVEGCLELILIHGNSYELAETLWGYFWSGAKIEYGL
jgi:hypothetical protein